jgi:glycosyltransferase involved in cell wall biosynthesis
VIVVAFGGSRWRIAPWRCARGLSQHGAIAGALKTAGFEIHHERGRISVQWVIGANREAGTRGIVAEAILMDGSHLLASTGTGISSYARSLANTLRSTGCRVEILFGQRVGIEKSSLPIGLADQIFGNDPRTGWTVARNIGRSLDVAGFLGRALIRPSYKTTAVEVPVDHVELSSYEPKLPLFDGALNAHALFERANQLFALRGRFAEVEVPSRFAAAHWTAPMPVRARGIPNIYAVHDLIPLQFPHFVHDFGGRSAKLHSQIARQADLIVTLSDHSKGRIMDILGVPEHRVSVTYQPIATLPAIAQESAERLVTHVYGAQPGEYALYLGAIEPRKNIRRLIEAFLLAGLDIPLLIAGPLGWMYDQDLELIDMIAEQAVAKPLVRRLGYLPGRHVAALLKCARFLAFPSICEGFGLPVLEAMQLGIPVVSSNTSSLPEVTGDAAVLVNPLDVSEMAAGIRRIGNDRDLRNELGHRGPEQAKKFSQDAYTARMADAYRKIGIKLSAPAIG